MKNVAGKVALAAALLFCAQPAQARITRIVIDKTTALTGQTAAYQQLIGRAFGELDPADPHNSIITDINLGKDPDGKVRYITSFQLTLPTDLSNASGFLWHDVPNRGGRITLVGAERNLGDIGLSSGWQADNSGGTAVPAYASQTTAFTTGNPASNEWVRAPVAVNADGSSITGYIAGRIVNRSGTNSEPLNVQGNPIPFLPASLDTTQAILRTRFHETIDGKISAGPGTAVIASTDWAFAHCDATHPWPGTPQDLNHADLPGSLPVHVCLKNGFDPTLLYELTYPVKDPYVEGVGFAAFRDLDVFFKTATQDDFGTANPVANVVKWSVIRGVSQSGNATRAYIQQGFNESESGAKVHDGAWPIIAGRRVSMNSRWAQPDGVLELYQMGSEGPQWWTDWPDTVRGLPTASILDRCTRSSTCPNVIEHFGGSEVYALKMTTEWVGTSANADIPLPDTVRRYYISSSTHGGGSGAMTQNSATTGAGCPGNNWGTAMYRANPMPEGNITNSIRAWMRAWLMSGTPPPPSIWPRISTGDLVDPTMAATHQPHGIPGIPETIFQPANFVNPVFQYNWGPFFNESDATGVPTDEPPDIQQVIKMKIPRVNSDGNEMGGVPTPLHDAPLGTYLGWNLTPSGFHEGEVCDYVGGFIPFATTAAQRTGPATNFRFHIAAKGMGGDWSRSTPVSPDPRPSLTERYGTHAGYVAAVAAAVTNAESAGYLLQADGDAINTQAQASDVLVSATDTHVPAFGEVNIGTDASGPGWPTNLEKLVVNKGDTISVGYDLSLPGTHAAATINVMKAQVILQFRCEAQQWGATTKPNSGPVLIDIADAQIAVPANSTSWFPADSASYQGTLTIPDLCNNRPIWIGSDATFTAMIGAQ